MSGEIAGQRVLIYMGGFARVGGIEVFARQLAELYQENGAEVALAYWPIRGESPILDEMRALGITMIRSGVARGVRWDLPDRALARKVKSRIAEFDSIIFLKLFSDSVLRTLLNAIEAANRSRTNGRGPIRSIYIPAFCPEEDETWRERPKPDASLLNRINLFCGQCERMVGQCRTFLSYKGETRCVPYLNSGVEEATPIPGFGEHVPMRVAYMGRMAEQKNVGGLIEAFARYLEKYDSEDGARLELHLYGGGDRETELREMVAASRHSARVNFHGEYAPSDASRIIAENHFFAQSTRFEGQCLVALEIMSGGRYLIATRAGCLESVLNEVEVGRIVEQNCPDDFAEAIHQTVQLLRRGEIAPERIAAHYCRRFAKEVLLPHYLELISPANTKGEK